MASIAREDGGGVDPRVSLLLVLLAVGFLFVSILSIGVVAVFVMNSHSPEGIPEGLYDLTTTTLRRITTTTTTTSIACTTAVVTTTVYDGVPTTFLEYVEPPTTTTLATVEDCHSYHGPFRTCGAKNLAWFDKWA
ncbi:MAG: hypothetical protein FJY77_04295 [Candidatus Altiarchaeales archaeon]|nr:hypothetical protein [Candidatus Altiarchaeales archaeon]